MQKIFCLISILSCGLFLSGCLTGGPEVLAPTKPVLGNSEARKLVVSERARLWKDPESIRDATVGEPYRCSITSADVKNAYDIQTIEAPASCVCLELNARNSYGGYTGIKRSIARFTETGGIDVIDAGTRGFEEYCRNLKPFPELNGRAKT
jgi:hypothetical protein